MVEANVSVLPVDLMVRVTLQLFSAIESAKLEVTHLVDPVLEAVSAYLCFRGIRKVGEAILRPVVEEIAAQIGPIEYEVDRRLDSIRDAAVGIVRTPVIAIIVVIERVVRRISVGD